MNGLREEWGEQLLVLQVNVNHKENRSLVEEFEGQFSPTFILFDASGQETWRAIGSIDPVEARRQADALLDQISENRPKASEQLANKFGILSWSTGNLSEFRIEELAL